MARDGAGHQVCVLRNDGYGRGDPSPLPDEAASALRRHPAGERANAFEGGSVEGGGGEGSLADKGRAATYKVVRATGRCWCRARMFQYLAHFLIRYKYD